MHADGVKCVTGDACMFNVS